MQKVLANVSIFFYIFSWFLYVYWSRSFLNNQFSGVQFASKIFLNDTLYTNNRYEPPKNEIDPLVPYLNYSKNLPFDVHDFYYQTNHYLIGNSSSSTRVPTENGLPLVAMVFARCNEPRLYLSDIEINAYEVLCNKTTNVYDCNEASSYLTFVIDHYYHPVAKYYFFSHPHEQSWHLSVNLSEKVKQILAMKDNFRKSICGPETKNAWHVQSKGFHEPYASMFYPIFRGIPWLRSTKNIHFEYGCCGTFLIREIEIHKRPRSDYVRLRDQLRQWAIYYYDAGVLEKGEMFYHCPNYFCGRLAEYSWSYILASAFKMKKCSLP